MTLEETETTESTGNEDAGSDPIESGASDGGGNTAASESDEESSSQPNDGDESEGSGEGNAQDDESSESEGDESEGEGDEAGEPVDMKFRASVYNKETGQMEQKELDIDKKFADFMKESPENALAVRRLHEQAHGIESFKERLTETRAVATKAIQDNDHLKEGLASLRNTYQSAVNSGNLLKLDNFFAKMNIPQDVIMQYAIKKAELTEMDPVQRQAILGRQQAEQQAEEAAEQQRRMNDTMATTVTQLKLAQVDTLLSRSEVANFAKAYDAQLGREGAFRKAVIQTGQLAWYQRGEDLSAEQAIRHVVTDFEALAKSFPNPGAAQPGANGGNTAAATGPNGKPVVQRTTKTIPNIQGRSSSPLKSKPRSVEDLQKIYKEMTAE